MRSLRQNLSDPQYRDGPGKTQMALHLRAMHAMRKLLPPGSDLPVGPEWRYPGAEQISGDRITEI